MKPSIENLHNFDAERRKFERSKWKFSVTSTTYAFASLLELVVDEQRQIFRRLVVQVQEVLEVRRDHVLEGLLVVERVMQEVIEAIFQVEQILYERDGIGAALLLLHQRRSLLAQIFADAVGNRLDAVGDAREQFVHAGQVVGLRVLQHVHNAGVLHLYDRPHVLLDQLVLHDLNDARLGALVQVELRALRLLGDARLDALDVHAGAVFRQELLRFHCVEGR